MDAVERFLNGELRTVQDFILASANHYGAKFTMKENRCWEYEKIEARKDYYKNIEECYNKIIYYSNMPLDQLEKLMNEELAEQEKERKDQLQALLSKKYKCTAMINDIKAWKVPKPEFNKLKDYAIKTLMDIIELECNNIQELALKEEREKITVSEFAENKISFYLKKIQYYSRKLNEEIEYAQAKNKWMSELFKSFYN